MPKAIPFALNVLVLPVQKADIPGASQRANLEKETKHLRDILLETKGLLQSHKQRCKSIRVALLEQCETMELIRRAGADSILRGKARYRYNELVQQLSKEEDYVGYARDSADFIARRFAECEAELVKLANV